MATRIRIAALLLGSLVSSLAMAQYTWILTGILVPCDPGATVHIQSQYGTLPVIDTVVAVDPATCSYTLTFNMQSEYVTVISSTSCNGSTTSDIDSTIFSPPNNILAYDTVILDCGGVPYDCAGVAYGTNLPGSPCNDWNPTTSNDMWQADCSCVGDTSGNIYDCLGNPYGPNMPGSPCDDLDSLTTNDAWTVDCECQGGPFLIDCNGVPLGPDVPGAPCDDGDPLTVGDVWNVSCVCVGYSPQPCSISFQVHQAWSYDSTTTSETPIPNSLWASVNSNGAWPFQYLWDFGDGNSSTENYPTHTYAGSGPYNLCVTITDAIGCTHTTCDSVSVDENGMIVGMGLEGGHTAALQQRSGFTIQMLADVPSTVTEQPTFELFNLWPNPATDMLHLHLSAAISGATDIQVIDINGSPVMRQRSAMNIGRNDIDVPIHDLPPGIYLLRVGSGSGSVAKRFVKTR